MSAGLILGVSTLAGMAIFGAAFVWRALLFVLELIYFSLNDPIDLADEEIADLKKEEKQLRARLERIARETDDPAVRARIEAALAE